MGLLLLSFLYNPTPPSSSRFPADTCLLPWPKPDASSGQQHADPSFHPFSPELEPLLTATLRQTPSFSLNPTALLLFFVPIARRTANGPEPTPRLLPSLPDPSPFRRIPVPLTSREFRLSFLRRAPSLFLRPEPSGSLPSILGRESPSFLVVVLPSLFSVVRRAPLPFFTECFSAFLLLHRQKIDGLSLFGGPTSSSSLEWFSGFGISPICFASVLLIFNFF